MREQRQKRMRGVIEGVATNAATAQIQGAILGDDGRRYKFTSLNDNRMTYAAAMKVDFQPSDYQAIDVRPIPAAAPPVRQQWEAQPPTPASSVPEAAYLPSKSKALIGLLCIFLGPLGGLIGNNLHGGTAAAVHTGNCYLCDHDIDMHSVLAVPHNSLAGLHNRWNYDAIR